MVINIGAYNDIIEKINNEVTWFEKLDIKNNNILLRLANGDDLNIRISEGSIPHLLGINLDYLNMTNKFRKNMTAYEKMKYLLDHPYIFQKLIVSKTIDMNYMFSKFVYKKVEAFQNNVTIKIEGLCCVVKYDTEKTYQSLDYADVCDYYIIRKCNDDYLALGLVKNGEVFYPTTSRKYETEEEFQEFMQRIARKQEITYSNLVNVSNPYTGFNIRVFPSYSDCEILTSNLMSISKKYNATPSIARDAFVFLNKINTRAKKEKVNINTLKLLSECIKSGIIFDSNMLNQLYDGEKIPPVISTLISVCNDSLSTYSDENHSELVKENNLLNENLDKTKENLSIQMQENEKLTQEIMRLKEENNEYREQLGVFENAYQKVMTLRTKK